MANDSELVFSMHCDEVPTDTIKLWRGSEGPLWLETQTKYDAKRITVAPTQQDMLALASAIIRSRPLVHVDDLFQKVMDFNRDMRHLMSSREWGKVNKLREDFKAWCDQHHLHLDYTERG